MAISTSTLNAYKHITTASIATALFKRGLKNQYIQNVYPLNSKKMIGEAFTLRYIPAREDLNPIDVFKNSSHPQRLAIEQCPKGSVLVIDSRKDARAASAGSILVTRLMKKGATGIVTDGGFRDSEAIAALDFPSFHQRASAPTNLTLHQAIDINVPIGCGDVAVFPGDLIVGDVDGVMVIPSYLAEEVAKECSAMEKYEEFVMEQLQDGESIKGLYPLTDADMKSKFEKWKKKNS